MALGGLVPFTQLAPRSSQALQQHPFSRETLQAALEALAEDVASFSSQGGWIIALCWKVSSQYQSGLPFFATYRGLL